MPTANIISEPSSSTATVIIQFVSPEGISTGPSLDVPLTSTPSQLTQLINKLLSNDEQLPYAFHLTSDHSPIDKSLQYTLKHLKNTPETIISITYHPQSLFRVRSVTRCTSSLPGHNEAILHTAFSPDSSLIATASGDTTVRLWNPQTQIPYRTLNAHKNWVLVVQFSPDSQRLASASMDGSVRIWNPNQDKPLGKPLSAHSKWVTSLAWQPFHISSTCTFLVSASKDNTLRIWNTINFTCHKLLAGHTAAVTCVKWSGENFIYSASQDRTIKIWDPTNGLPLRTIAAHGHWVNTMTLSTDYILRCGAFPTLDEEKGYQSKKLTQDQVNQRYIEIKKKTKGATERVVSGSDDFTLMLWENISRKDDAKPVKPIARMTGHQQLVNDVLFSPDGLYVASASFDKSVRLWDGVTGKFIFTFRGHVGAVYRIVWSADSRLLMSASRDSTCKVWELRTRKLKTDLPGHYDEVYTVDWSTDGTTAVSAGKDKVVKIWHH